jgi:hypothetical protein
MRIGIIGAGMIGGTLAALWTKAGHDVMVSSRHPGSLAPLVARLAPRIRAGTPEEAAVFGEVVLLAIPFGATAQLSAEVVSALAGKVVLDAGNPFARRDGTAAGEVEREARGSGAWTARHLPGARVVKAFNTVHYATLGSEAHRSGDRVAIPLAGDDPGALATASQLVSDAGFEPVGVGGLERAREFDPGTAVWNSGMTGRELRKRFQK